jgi:hypothetical protein
MIQRMFTVTVLTVALAGVAAPAAATKNGRVALEARRTTSITGGTSMTTSVTVSRNGRIDGVNELNRYAWITGKCGATRLVVRDANRNILYAQEVFRGCANPRTRRVDTFSRRIPASVAARVHRIDIEHYHFTDNKLFKRASYAFRLALDYAQDHPEVVAAAAGGI